MQKERREIHRKYKLRQNINLLILKVNRFNQTATQIPLGPFPSHTQACMVAGWPPHARVHRLER
jgi:hypothetical protein